MSDETDLSIPYGCDIDHRGVELSIDAVAGNHVRCEFVCPQCGQQLTKKLRGEFRRPHFAHYMDATDRNCPWRTDEGVRQAYARSRQQALEAAQRIRLFIRRRPHSQEMALFGAVPPLSSEDIAHVTQQKLEGAFHVDDVGTRRKVQLNDLLPNGGAGWVELDPTADRFRIDIRPVELVNGGSWVATGIAPGNVFVGTDEWGRLFASPKRVSSGQHLYYIVNPGSASKLPYEEKLRLGRFEVLRFVADQRHLTSLRSIVPGIEVDAGALHIDVVYPLSVPPSDLTLGRVRIPKGEEVILSVVLPPDKDRPLEAFPIPFNGSGQVTIPAVGLNVARFLKLNLAESDSQRILIHWPFESERDWILDFIPVEPGPVRAISTVDPVIGLQIDGGPLLTPLLHPRIEIKTRPDLRGSPTLPTVKLVAPPGYSVNFRGEVPGNDGKPVWLEEGEQVDAATLTARFGDLFARGCRTLEVGFGTLGSLTLHTSVFFDKIVEERASQKRVEAARAEAAAREERVRQEEAEKIRQAEKRRTWREQMQEKIRDTLRARGELPQRHVSDVLVRNLLGLPEDTTREDLRVLRNLVSRARREFRSEGSYENEGGE